MIETRSSILSGERDLADLVDGHVGEVKARIQEEDGRLIIRKTCKEHGTFEDVLSIDPEFSHLVERRYPGRDFRTMGDELVHRHGTSTIKYGRGAVLTIDLTNRCNMMCNPCFMDANQVGYVHELTLDEIKEILDDSISFKPRRQMTVQFSGGEPTMSPHFLEACRYAKDVGYFSVQAATNGLRFALEPEYAYQAKEAGFDLAYFQFDGVTNSSNSHRHISNLFDVKQRAIDVMFEAGIDIIPVTTVVNTVNDDQVGSHPRLRHQERRQDGRRLVPARVLHGTRRGGQRRGPPASALHHLAHGPRVRALLRRQDRPLPGLVPPGSDGQLQRARRPHALAPGARGPELREPFRRSCHPNCGSSILIIANRKTGVWSTITQFFDLENFMHDIAIICDTARGQRLTMAQIALSFVRNFDPNKTPSGMNLLEFAKLFFNGKMGGILGKKMREQDWTIQWIGGMWFQDLWTYDFRRTEMCVIPYATQEGEISFCAYNTGVGWRQIVENMHTVAKTKDWFAARGRHQIYAGDKAMELPGKRSLPIVGAPQKVPVGAHISGGGH